MIPEIFNEIKISNFGYELPEERIAQKPVGRRDASKLLLYKNGQISHHFFYELPQLMKATHRLVLNNAKVIPARMIFYKNSGARIEIFILEPLYPFNSMEQIMGVQEKVTWACIIGNAKKWKTEEPLVLTLEWDGKPVKVEAKLISKESQEVEFTWNSSHTFAELLERIGKIPLPPYIKREVEKEDVQTYQTIFASNAGAVAAPTAALHFTEALKQALLQNKNALEELTLYVGAGTFAPVKTERVVEHDMHREIFSISRSFVSKLLNEKDNIAVGTTTLRALESMYWIGFKITQTMKNPLSIGKLDPYTWSSNLSWTESLEAVQSFMTENKLESLLADTAILIMPGYKFRSVKALITNFHHPNTTLIMLIAACIGEAWREVYREALENDYRFLSYGDSSLLWL